ncbi:MAG: extracellular solute-binding protein [Pirellulaceae bacterium]|nr:extracellular solute-binding protein [Pirellulaceae bacterium]
MNSFFRSINRRLRFSTLSAWLAVANCLGCVPQPENAVVLYSAADREYAQPILDAFERRAEGIEIVRQFDIESTKTVGLANRIVAEAQRPQCDVFWNNEIMHTLSLESKGLLQPIDWEIPHDWPAEMRSRSGHWVGVAARARVLIVNRQVLADVAQWPNSVLELGDAKWSGKCGVALPLFGTTATHFTVLYDQLGVERAEQFFQQVADNAVVLSGNKQVALQVAAGKLAWGLTDTDDALLEIDAGLPVNIVYPDQLPHQLGTLRIPNTVAVVAGGPHPVAAVKLANYLVSEDTEGRLAMGASGQFPIRPGHSQLSRAQFSRDGQRLLIRWMAANFESAASRWPESSQRLQQIFKR